jgi:hypothetical protein
MDDLIQALKTHGHIGEYLSFVGLLRLSTGYVKITPNDCKNLSHITICATSLVMYDKSYNPEVYDIRTPKEFGIYERTPTTYKGELLKTGIYVNYDICKYVIKDKYYDARFNEINGRIPSYYPRYKLSHNYKIFTVDSIIIGPSSYSIVVVDKKSYLVKVAIRDLQGSSFPYTVRVGNNDRYLYYFVAYDDSDFYLMNSNEQNKMYPTNEYIIEADQNGLYGGYKIQNEVVDIQCVYKIDSDYVADCIKLDRRDRQLFDLDMRKPSSGLKTKAAAKYIDNSDDTD